MVRHSERASRVSTDDVFGNFLKSVLKTFRCGIYVQWNLSIADMIYSGQLSMADTFPKNGLHVFFYKHGVFQSEARICLSFSQIEPQNMLKICLT